MLFDKSGEHHPRRLRRRRSEIERAVLAANDGLWVSGPLDNVSLSDTRPWRGRPA